MILQQDYFQHVTVGNGMEDDGKSRFYYIEADEYFSQKVFSNFSILLPLDGTVFYKTDYKTEQLQAGQCLLTYKELNGLTIDLPTPIRCICIDIKRHVFEKALQNLAAKAVENPGNLKADHFFSSEFFEYIYTERDTCMVKQLKKLAQDTLEGNIMLTDEEFVQIAEDVIKLEFIQYTRLDKLPALQIQTKKELLLRLLKGKIFIDENYLSNPSVSVIAQYVQISDFYFFRSFKAAFKESPYQYMIGKRLEHAKQLILEGMNFTYVASICSFNDLPTFSKAFKRRYSITPMQFKYPKHQKAGRKAS